MARAFRILSAYSLAAALALSAPIRAHESIPAKPSKTAKSAPVRISALWRDRGNAQAVNLFYGPGGKEHQPAAGTFTFVKEDINGGSPKFDVIDSHGVHWKAKLGDEAKSETAATRLLWAAGYYTDEDYYLPHIRVNSLPDLKRGQQFVSANGVIHAVRLERKIKGEKGGNWSWFDNPFVGTRELDGLRILMTLINNWDLKEINNSIYVRNARDVQYAVSDLGATFGQTGNTFTRSKSDPIEYSQTKFVQKVTSGHVDFHLKSRPFFLSTFDVPYYVERTRMQQVAKDIPVEHARWLGKLLGRLTDRQVRDCFRAAGYSPQEVELSAATVRERIDILSHL